MKNPKLSTKHDTVVESCQTCSSKMQAKQLNRTVQSAVECRPMSHDVQSEMHVQTCTKNADRVSDQDHHLQQIVCAKDRLMSNRPTNLSQRLKSIQAPVSAEEVAVEA